MGRLKQLGSRTLREIESEVARKRTAWFRQHGQHASPTRPPSPRRAYELFLFEYLTLSPDDVPVVSENEREIVWASHNRCPTLEACQRLGMDTRHVCRAAYEKSTQALISQLDPQLRFLRSYKDIRPYAASCREAVVRVDFEAMMRMGHRRGIELQSGGQQGIRSSGCAGERDPGRSTRHRNDHQRPESAC